MTTTATETTQVYRVYIEATPQAIWQAVTDPEWTVKYGYGGRAAYEPELRPGASYRALADEDLQAAGMPEVVVKGEVIEADPPRKLVQTWHAQWDRPGTVRLSGVSARVRSRTVPRHVPGPSPPPPRDRAAAPW